MPGQPQQREAAWLWGEDPDIPLALVRLEERMDGSGVWVVLLNSPAESPTRGWERPDEGSARAALEAIYAEGRPHGEWEIRRTPAE